MTKLDNSNKKSETLSKSLMIIKRYPQNWRLKWLIWMTSGANLRGSTSKNKIKLIPWKKNWNHQRPQALHLQQNVNTKNKTERNGKKCG